VSLSDDGLQHEVYLRISHEVQCHNHAFNMSVLSLRPQCIFDFASLSDGLPATDIYTPPKATSS